jgi:hypothetical protein
LADAAEVSRRSLRDHVGDLVAVGLVVETPEGYRLDLAQDTDEERLDYSHVPVYTAAGAPGNPAPDDIAARQALRQAATDAGLDVAAGTDPPGWGLVYRPLEAMSDLHEPGPYLKRLLPALWGVNPWGKTAETGVQPGERRRRPVSLGPTVRQMSVQASLRRAGG